MKSIFILLQVAGFNAHTWMVSNVPLVPKLFDSMAKLLDAGQLELPVTEYELSTYLDAAVEHAMRPGNSTKVVLRMRDIGTTY